MIEDNRIRKDGRVSIHKCTQCGEEALLQNYAARKRKLYMCSRKCFYEYRYQQKNIYYRDGLKLCLGCKEHKPLEDYAPAKTGHSFDGRVYRCKECIKATQAPKIKKPNFNQRNSTYQRLYGITEYIYDEMLLKQEGKCYICGTDKPGRHSRMNVDHCHKTGRVRKLLCSHCNTALGSFKDNPETLRKAALYIEEHQEDI